MARGVAQACAAAAAEAYKARGGGGAGAEASGAGGSSARVLPAARVARVASVAFSEVRCCAVQLYVL